MPRPRPPYLVRQITRHGKPVWYVRRGKGPRIRIRAVFGTPEFAAEYQTAVNGAPALAPIKAGAGTLGWLIGRYRQSSAWASLAPGTRDQRGNVLRSIEKQSGDIQFTSITRKKIIEGRERRKDTPHAANTFVRTLSHLFKWAVEMELVSDNPARDVKKLTVKSDGFHVWTDAELARFEERWPIGTRERLAFDLLLYTGLRRGDAARLGRQHVKAGWFRVTTEKNGVVVEAPILPPLQRSIDVAPTGDLAFIVGERGRPMAKESFGNWFREACEAAGVPGSAHGLRKAGATRAAEAGATTAQLKAMFGWTDDKMPAHYTRTADRARLAGDAMALLDRRPKT
jgi:integrase